jgi:Heavy metal binding domain
MEELNPQNYTCPMHPKIVRDNPGNCPICGMNLVALKSKASDIAIGAFSNDYVLNILLLFKAAKQKMLYGILRR